MINNSRLFSKYCQTKALCEKSQSSEILVDADVSCVETNIFYHNWNPVVLQCPRDKEKIHMAAYKTEYASKQDKKTEELK